MSEENLNRSFKLNAYSNECSEIKDPQALKALGIVVTNNKSDNSETDQFTYKNFENNQDKAPCIPPWAKTLREIIGYSKFHHGEIKTEKAGAGKEISTGKRKVAFIGAHEDVFIFGLKPVQGKKDLFYFRHPSTKSKQIFDKDTGILGAVKADDDECHTELHKPEKNDKLSVYKEEKSLEKINTQEEINNTAVDDTDLIMEVSEEKKLLIHSELKVGEESEKLSKHSQKELEAGQDLDTEENYSKAQDDGQNENLLKQTDESEEDHDLKDMKINEVVVDLEKCDKYPEKEQKEIEKEEVRMEEAERKKKEILEKEEIMREEEVDREEKETADEEKIMNERHSERYKNEEKIVNEKHSERDKKETIDKENNRAVEIEKMGSVEEEEFTDEESTTQTANEGGKDNEIEQVITENKKIIQENIENKKSLYTEEVLEEEKVMDISTGKNGSLLEKTYADTKHSILLSKESQQATSKITLSKQFMEEAIYEVEGNKNIGQNLEESLYQKKYISSDTDVKSKRSFYGKRKASVTIAGSVSLGSAKQTKQVDIYNVPTSSNEAYLRECLGKHLVTALSEAAYKCPADPIHYIAQFLYKQCSNLQARQENDDEKENLLLLWEHNPNKQKALKTLNIVKLQNIKDKLLKTSAQLPVNEDNEFQHQVIVKSELKQEPTVENEE